MKAILRNGLNLLKNALRADLDALKHFVTFLSAFLIVCAVMVATIYPLIGGLLGSTMLAICVALGVGFGIRFATRSRAYLLLAAAAGIFAGGGVFGATQLRINLPVLEDPLEYLVLMVLSILGAGFVLGFCGGLIAALGTGYRAYLILAVLAGIPVGILFPNFAAASTGGLLAGLATSPFRERRTYLVLAVIGPLVGAIAFSLLLVLYVEEEWFWGDLLVGGIATILVAVSTIIGQRLGLRLGHLLKRGLDEFARATPYLRDMVWPLIGFTLIYLCIVVVFGGLFATACDLSTPEKTFGFDKCKSYWHFFYLSLMTMTTLGHDDLNNASTLIQTFIIAEAVIGIAWIVVVFAAIISYLEDKRESPQWEKLDRVRERAEAERDRADMEQERAVHEKQRADTEQERTKQLQAELHRAQEQLKEAQR